MTKAALRRQERERQLREQEQEQQEQRPVIAESSSGDSNTPIAPAPQIPHMEPPPPYDAPHLPSGGNTTNTRPNGLTRRPSRSCLSGGSGESSGCLNYNSGSRGSDYKVEGCLNYDSRDGCLNYKSEDGCLNYQSQDGCLNYQSRKSIFGEQFILKRVGC